ncbi:MAG: hypothetical protein ACREML_01950 [Vulcanimicrobiaceae bacterium]
MSVELYPNIADLDEKLSALEDAELAGRIVGANPELFTSAAAREELSVFAAAWKRSGTLGLAVTAALAVGLGYVFAPHAVVRPAAKQVIAHKVAARPERPAVHPVRHVPVPASVTVSHPLAVRAAAPAALSVRHAVAYHRPAAASYIAAPAAHAVAAPAAVSSAGTQAEAPIQYEANAQVVSSANAPPTDAVLPDGTKSGIVAQHSDSAVQPIVDSCTPQGGRLGAITRR